MKVIRRAIDFITSNFAILCIFVSFCVIVAVALGQLTVLVDNNNFNTGAVKINLNDGKAIVNEKDGIYMEPGRRIKKKFFVENQGTADVWYKLYLDQVGGKLADELVITIKNKEKVIYKGKADKLNKKLACVTDSELKVGERRDLEMYFYLPEDVGNEMQGQKLTFILGADAVQAKNNPDKKFS